MKNQRNGESFTPKKRSGFPPDGFFPKGTEVVLHDDGIAISLADSQYFNTMFVKYEQTIYKHLRYIVFAEDNPNIKE